MAENVPSLRRPVMQARPDGAVDLHVRVGRPQIEMTDFDRDLSDRWVMRWLGGLLAALVIVSLIAWAMRRFL